MHSRRVTNSIGRAPLARRLCRVGVAAAVALGYVRLGQTADSSTTIAANAAIDAPPASSAGTPTLDFNRDVLPILARKCLRCHGPDKQEAGLRLDDRAIVGASLPSGRHAIVRGRPDESELVRRLTADDSERMPPDEAPLDVSEAATLKNWIAQGAAWPVHWAYRPLEPIRPPSVEALAEAWPWANWPRNPLDQFVLAKLTEREMHPAPEADRRTLLRRLYFDTLGLPPTCEEVDAFLADPSVDAYEARVDQLLASPRFGERWARHWMDVVHYADSHGFEHDNARNLWPYRDYLIRAFNADMTYRQFVREQIAGDVLAPDDPQALTATGFLAAGPWDQSALQSSQTETDDFRLSQYLDRDDIISTIMSTFVSSTVQCARCHDHKFDPISQEEYYGLQAVVAGIDKAEREFDPDPAVAKKRRELAKRRAEAQGRQSGQEGEHTTQQEIERQLQEIDAQLAALPAPQSLYCGTNQFKAVGGMTPASAPRVVHVLERGEVRRLGSVANPGALSYLPGLPGELHISDPTNEGLRRAALADWLVDDRNGLAWRSIVNRVWQRYFGRGLVDTPNDFGRMGSPPTHVELLDWLAITVRDQGGTLKALHRLILTSAAYRQSSQASAEATLADPENRYLSRMPARRLDAESLRDAMLVVSGHIDWQQGGPPVRHFVDKPTVNKRAEADYKNFNVDDPANCRRSVYRYVCRTMPDPLMTALDCPDGTQLTPARSESITALQALALMNDKFVVRQSEHIAARIRSQTADGATAATLAERMFRLVLRRPPQALECQDAAAYISQHGLANACRFLLNCNEFAFID